MDQALSLYLLETIPLLDPESETHALDLLTLVESILENPELILRRQLDKVKDKAVAEMKAEGLDYDQRMEKLEKLEYPKPLRDFVYSTFNAFADRHPWVGEENIRPKSIAREMFEGFRSFSDYVQEYDLERAEGLLLRHLNSVYKVLEPDRARRGEDRHRARDGALPARHAARGGLEPARRVGEDARPRLPARRDGRGGPAAAAAGGAAGRHARHEGLHGGDPHARLLLPARVVDRRRRGRARRRSTRRPTATASRGRPSACAPRARPTAPSTGGLRLDPEARNLRHTHVEPVGRRRRAGSCSRCSSTPRASTTGCWSSTWTSPPRARWASRCSSCCASAAWPDEAGQSAPSARAKATV